jgi:mannose-6-phosphate isomerase-like protein (cupin superfamily)
VPRHLTAPSRHARLISATLAYAFAAACGTSETRASSETARSRGAAPPAEATSDVGVPPPGAGGIDYYPAAKLAHIADSLARTGSTGHTLLSRGPLQYLQIRRSTNGVPEVHDHRIDVTVVQSGRATLLTGGRMEGGHVESPGEHRGGRIVGGVSRPVGLGDLLIIPAGIPHQYEIARGDSLRYLTVKVLNAAPARRAVAPPPVP